MPRSRARYLTLALLVVVLGLASRQYQGNLPALVSTYAGDTLWAAMVFLLAAAVWIRAGTATLAWAAVLFSFGIELSQLYHAAWIDSVRATRIGALVLGQGFLWSDLFCYMLGVTAAAGMDLLLRQRASVPAPARAA